MTAWTVHHRRTEDEDRLHVHAPDGSEAGWLSLRTGRIVLAHEYQRSAFSAAVARRRLASTDSVSAPTAAPRPAAAEAAGDRPDPGAPVLTALARIVGQRTPANLPGTSRRKVAGELDRLLPGWHVVPSVPLGVARSDDPHLVVGPGGVYTVHVATHPGGRVVVDGDTFLLGGKPMPYLRRAATEAERAGRLLTAACGFPVPVQGMLVLVGEVSLTVHTPPSEVYVATRRTVTMDLTRMPRTLTAPVADVIVAAAGRPETWDRP